jgi:hypothetical protein
MEPPMNADGRRFSPESKTASPLAEPDPVLASPQAAFSGGCQELGDLRTEATERNIFAEKTILHACSTALVGRDEDFATPGVLNSGFWYLSYALSGVRTLRH